MNLINAIILGVVEGLTEFLPISSTAHLIITSKILKITQTDFQKFFEVFIQSGAILAVIFLYFSYVLVNKKIINKIFFSFLPTAIVGFLLYKLIKNIFFESYFLIVFSIFFIGALFLLIESFVKNKKLKLTKSMTNINLVTAIIIGLVQALAVIPGVSRSGIVLIFMILLGYKRDESAIYSFLLAVPTIISASIFDAYQMRKIAFFTTGNIWFLTIGFITSFLTAYLSVKWLISYLKKNSLSVFGVYRIILAVILMTFIFV